MRIRLSFWLALCLALSSFSADARERSAAAKNDFKRMNPCPSNGDRRGPCPGYVIDHINPLDCGGADAPGNMQWQTVEEGKAKDRWERKDCHVSPGYSPAPVPSAAPPPSVNAQTTGIPRHGTLEILKWTDEDGKVHYGERPASAKGNFPPNATELPYDNSGTPQYGSGGGGYYRGSGSSYGGGAPADGTVYTGPRGGRYTVTSGGNKSYIGGGYH